MAKVITLSRRFPAGHPKAGQPTKFIEKVWKSLLNKDVDVADHIYEAGRKLGGYQYADDVLLAVESSEPKNHTMREGKRWKDGDMASLRFWSDKPYNSPQVIMAPDIKLKVKDVEISKEGFVQIDGKSIGHITLCHHVAANDGLTKDEFTAWFKKLPFSGQLLIWNNENLPY